VKNDSGTAEEAWALNGLAEALKKHLMRDAIYEAHFYEVSAVSS
jgi:hypothetical protein